MGPFNLIFFASFIIEFYELQNNNNNYMISVSCAISAVSQPAFAKPESVDNY